MTAASLEEHADDGVLLEEVFGLPLLAYLCASEPSRMIDRLRKPNSVEAELDPRAEKIISSTLIPLARTLQARDPAFRDVDLEILLAPVDGSEYCLGTQIHIEAGGDIHPEIYAGTADDPVKRCLARIAVDAYAVLLAQRDGLFGAHVPLFTHPLRGEIASAIEQDASLVGLYPHADTRGCHSGFLVDSFGAGHTTSPNSLAGEIIAGAWARIKSDEETPTVQSLAACAKEDLDRLRVALSGAPVTVPVKLSFTGLRLCDSEVIATPWGRLRRIRESERTLVPTPLQQTVTGSTEAGTNLTISYGGEMVLDADSDYRVTVLDVPDPNPTDFDNVMRARMKLAGVSSLGQLEESVTLAISLALPRRKERSVMARLAWVWAGHPLHSGSGIIDSRDTQAGPSFSPYELRSSECREVERWCRLIHDHPTDRIGVATARFLRAASDRTDASDRLVDSVIVWENLFGTRQETGLRISASMAWLLGADVETREALRSEVSRLYGRRSEIVHGRAGDPARLREDADRALEISQLALRHLLDVRPELLDIKEQAQRANLLMMGG